MNTVSIDELAAKGLVADTTATALYVLVVDPDSETANAVAELLRQHGYAALTADDGLSAMQLAEIAPPELLLSEICLPGFSGVELATLIRSSIPDCRILLFSSSEPLVHLVEQTRALGPEFSVFQKTIHPQQLLNEVFRRSEKMPRSRSLRGATA